MLGFLAILRFLMNTQEQLLAERVGFEPTWELTPPIRFRVGAVMAASVPLRDLVQGRIIAL